MNNSIRTIDFGEKVKEYSPKHGKDLPVWKTPKYLESKAKAEEIINSNKYGVQASDFWILMNITKSEQMAYNGLIISHNGCLKINDRLENKFDPQCVTVDKDGYKNSLVYSYCSPAQGIYEVGEVSASNCKNEYPYAMAFKRLFDRVVLKLSKLAYSGIYSESESEEFTQQRVEGADKPQDDFTCQHCGKTITSYEAPNGKVYSAKAILSNGLKKYNKRLCSECQNKMKKLDEIVAQLNGEAAAVLENGE